MNISCMCCSAELPPKAKTALCGPCMRSLVLRRPRAIKCALHDGTRIDTKKVAQ